jgi:hypothetical protein
MSEATARENQFVYAAEPVTDFAAKAIGDKSASMRKQHPDDPMHGVQYRVRKVDKTPDIEAEAS